MPRYADVKRRLNVLAPRMPPIPAFVVELTSGKTITLHGAEVLSPALDGDVVKITCMGNKGFALLAQKLSERVIIVA